MNAAGLGVGMLPVAVHRLGCAGAVLAALAAAGCCAPPPPAAWAVAAPRPGAAPVAEARVVLLPQPDGQPSAVVLQPRSVVRRGVDAGGVSGAAASEALTLDRPFQVAEDAGGEWSARQADAQEIQARYGALLAGRPPRPVVHTVQFLPNTNRLAPQSQQVLEAVRQDLAGRPVAEVLVTGHTDRTGSSEANDRLSLQRAQTVRDWLVAAGIPAEAISAFGRGEREPVVPTGPNVPEPRNRRVEIKLR